MENHENNKTKCSHNCSDNEDGFVCHCPEGFRLENDLKTCKLVETETTEETEDLESNVNNESDEEVGTVIECTEDDMLRCKPGKCIIESTSIRCECPAGFIEKSSSCHDLDECQYGSHDCSHNCHNLYGNYECSCPAGLKLHSDGKTCDDINECEYGEDGICGDMVCKNTYGSYKCVCPDTKQLNEHGHCVETNLCGENNGGCSHSCRTHNEVIICECPEDMDLDADQKTCVYSDPCTDAACSHFCDATREDICYCPLGFELEDDQRTCIDTNECDSNNGECDHICHNDIGGSHCSCRTGTH